MKTSEKNGGQSETQKDYSFSFKFQLVKEIGQRELTTKSQSKLKYGIQGDSAVTKWL